MKRLLWNVLLIGFFIIFAAIKSQAQSCGDQVQSSYANFSSCLSGLVAYEAEYDAENPTNCPRVYGGGQIHYSGGYLYVWASVQFVATEYCAGGPIAYVCDSPVWWPGCGDVAIPVAQMPTQAQPKPDCAKGSVIQVDNQVLGEIVPIVGAHFSMTYFSNRVTGRLADYTIHLPITATEVPTALTSVAVIVKDASSSTLYSHTYLANTTGLSYDFTWNGLDSSSNPTLGSATFNESVTQNWAASGGIAAFTIGPMASDYVLGNFKAKLIGLGGWVPSIYHFYDINGQKIYNGDGSTRSVAATTITGGYSVAEDDASLVYYFDSNGKQTSTKTGLLGTTIYTFNYDGSGRLSTITEPFSQTTTFHRDLSGNLTSIESPKGQSTTVTLDANGYIHTFTNPHGDVYTMTYVNAGGLLYTFEKPNGALSTFTYDAYGNLTQDAHASGFTQNLAQTGIPTYINRTTALGYTTQYNTASPDSTSLSRSVVYPDAHTDTYSSAAYDGFSTENSSTGGDTLSRTLTDDPRFGPQASYVSQSTFNYTETDTTLAVTQSNPTNPFSVTASTKVDTTGALVVTTTYDGTTKLFSSATDVGRTSSVGIDTYERVLSSQRGNLNSVGYTYSNEKLTDIDQSTRNTHFTYNTNDTLASITNSLSKTTSFGYDTAGRVNLVTLPDSRQIAYTYDSDGNIATITPPSSSAHTLAYNSDDLFESYNQPVLGSNPVTTLSYTYNDDNKISEIVKPNGDTIDYAYDGTTGNLATVTGPSGTYTYGFYAGNGLPSSISSPSYTWSVYPGYSGTTPVYLSTSGPDAGSYFSYGKTLTGGLVSADDVTGTSGDSSISYTYDDDNYLETAGDLSLTFDTPNGLLSGTSLSNITDTYTYNSFGEVTGYLAKIGTTTVYSLTLGRDAGERVYTKSENLNGTTKNYGYGFDDSGRLHTTTLAGSTVATYNYSNNSNRTSGTIYGTSLTATYNAQDSLTAYNTFTYAYNMNGDLTSKTNTTTSETTSYVYDEYGNLTQVTLPSSTVITYDIDPLNRRVGKSSGGTVLKRWVYMDQTRISAELDPSGNITKRFVYGSKSNVPDYMIDVPNSEEYRIISDQLGSPRLVIKVSDGSIAQKMEHDEFGNVLQDTNPGFTPFGFAGGLYDADTKLVRFSARDYDPMVGRWLSKDPILFKGGDTNLYGYVQNDPVNGFDPLGLWTVQLGGSFNLQFGPVGAVGGGGIAIDGHGNVGLYSYYGGQGGIGGTATGLGGSIQTSNASSISNLSGTFNNSSAHFGEGFGGSLDFFNGTASDGSYVIGQGATFGAQVGASACGGATNTSITPLTGGH